MAQPNRQLAGTPSIGTSSAYAAGDVLGGILPFSGAARGSEGGGFIRTVVVTDLAQKNQPLDLVLFDSNPSASNLADNAPFGLATADVARILGVVPIGTADYLNLTGTAGTRSVATIRNVGLGYRTVGGQGLYGVLRHGGTVVWSGTADLTVQLQVDLS